MSDFNRDDLGEKKLSDFKPVVRKAMPEPHYEEEEEEEGEASSFIRIRVLMPIIGLAIVSFVSYAWYTDKFAISRESGDLPVVKASADTLREKPEDPGGMKIINRDKRVYDAISGKDNDKDKKGESILPAPEEPLAHDEVAKLTGEKAASAPELINKLPEEKPAQVSSTETPEKVAPADGKASELENVTIANREEPAVKAEAAVVPADKPAESVKAAEAIVIPPTTTAAAPAKPVVSPAPVKIEAKEPKKETATKAVTADDIKDVAPKKKAAVETIKKTPATRSGYRVQLGSYRSEGDLEISWKAIKKKFSTILSGMDYYVEKKDLGEKGTFYRLQISGFKNEADARKACDALKEKKQECLFVGK